LNKINDLFFSARSEEEDSEAEHDKDNSSNSLVHGDTDDQNEGDEDTTQKASPPKENQKNE
jgi:hypothetical protein